MLNGDRDEIQRLLDRLQLPLRWFFRSSQPDPSDPSLWTFSTSIGSLKFERFKSGALRLQDPVTGFTAHLHRHTAEIGVGQDPETLDATQHRHLWHRLMKTLVAAYLQEQGFTPIHAAGVMDPLGRTWLIAGHTHSGKSTLTLGLIQAGWRFLSDDGLVLHQTQSGEVIAHAWAGSSLVDPVLGQTYPEIASHWDGWVDNRRLIDWPSLYPEHWIPAATPDVIVFPQFSPHADPAELDPISPGLGLAQLMQHSASALLEDPAPHLSRLKALGHQCSFYRLHLGSGLRHQPHRVAEPLLSQA